MARPQRVYTEEQKAEVLETLSKSENVWEKKRLMCLKLRMFDRLTGKEIAAKVGYQQVSVEMVISKYNHHGLSAVLWKKKLGNRRNMRYADEVAFIAPFIEKMKHGHKIKVAEVRAAYEKQVGHAVALSTVYRVLSRHGWEKGAPKTGAASMG